MMEEKIFCSPINFGKDPDAIKTMGRINGRNALIDEIELTEVFSCETIVEVMLDPILMESKYETIATGIAPIRITVPRCADAPRLAAAANGPGVGGTSV